MSLVASLDSYEICPCRPTPCCSGFYRQAAVIIVMVERTPGIIDEHSQTLQCKVLLLYSTIAEDYSHNSAVNNIMIYTDL